MANHWIPHLRPLNRKNCAKPEKIGTLRAGIAVRRPPIFCFCAGWANSAGNRLLAKPVISFASVRRGSVVHDLCLGGQQHGQDRSIRMTYRVDSDAADHTCHGSVGLCLHPGGAMLQAQMGQSRQQYASRRGARTFR